MILWKFELGDAGVDDLLEVGGWRVYVSRGNSSRFWGDFAPSYHFPSYIAAAPIYGTHTVELGHGVNCWWLWLAILVTLAYTEDRDLNFSPLTQSTTSQFLPVHPTFRFSFVMACFNNHILIATKDKTIQGQRYIIHNQRLTWSLYYVWDCWNNVLVKLGIF